MTPAPGWDGPPPPPPTTSRRGLLIVIIVAGTVLLLILLFAALVLARASKVQLDTVQPPVRPTGPPPPLTSPTTQPSPGPTTSVAGTGAVASLTATQVADLLKANVVKAIPDVPVGPATCPPGPFRVGHAIVCQVELDGSPVQYRVDITGDVAVEFTATWPVIDTDKAEALIGSKESGVKPDCGLPRMRQLAIGSTFSCRTDVSTWDFTVKDEGKIAGLRR